MITIVDYRMGNIGSVANMIRKVGGVAEIASSAASLRRATKLILPGVGHFDRGMQNLTDAGLVSPLQELVVERKVPILGICLGMQMMCKSSEEGHLPGLGWVDATVKRLDPRSNFLGRVPHMGWNSVVIRRANELFGGSFSDPQRFYFVHSYYVDCHSPDDVLTTTNYGADFCSSYARGNICGVQFHPEKSHAYGMNLFRNFLRM